MKNNLLFVSAIVMAISAFSGCQKEEDVKTPVNTGEVSGPITLNFSLSEETKALFGETGIKWTEGDVIRYTDQGLGNIKDITLAAGDIKDDGYRATVTTEGLYLANRSVFRMNYSTRNVAEWDFGYYGGCPAEERAANLVFTEWNKLTVKQSEAGVINPYFMFLHSGMNALDLTGEASVNVPMEILGTILRVMPYTTTHNSETIESISLVSNDKLGGCCGVNYSTGVYRDHKDVNWGPDTFKEYEVQLTTGFNLAPADSKVNSKPIYFSLPGQNAGHDIDGYAWVVKTDVATYYFSASDKLLSLSHNKVRNVYLNLDNAKGVRTTDTAKQLKYDGDVAADKTFDSAAIDNFDLGYLAAYVSDNAGAAWSVQEHTAGNEDFYAVTSGAVDLGTGTTPDWVTFGYGSLSTHLFVSVTENTGKIDRNAKITVTFPAQINGYTMNPLSRTKVFTVCQRGTATITPSITLSKNTADKAGEVVSGTIDILVDGVSATASEFDYYVKDLVLTCTNGSVSRDGKNLSISIAPNPTSSPRDVVLTASLRGSNDSETIVQAAGDSDKVYSFTYSLNSDWNKSSCKPRQLYFDNTAKSGLEDWVIIVTDLAESGNAYTAGAAFPSEDVDPLVKQVLGLSDSEYNDISEWLTLDVHVLGAQWIIVVRGMTANTSGSARTITGPFYNADNSEWDPAGTYTIGQNP